MSQGNASLAGMIRVLLVDDDRLTRVALHLFLDSADDIEVVAEATDGDEVLQQVHRHRPDVVVMDLRMRRTDGIAATRRLRALPAPPVIVAVTGFELDDDAVEALRAGADAFVLKDRAPEDLVDTVRAAAAGRTMVSPEVTRLLIDGVRGDGARDRAEARRLLGALTDRQRTIAAEVHLGRTNPEIAKATFSSDSTVKTHVSEILLRLNLASRTELATLVERAGGL